MQDKWKDLIPFYVVGTLPDNQKKALEAYIAQCGDPCADELEEWRLVASATWQSANDSATDLPPLSASIRAEVAKDAQLRASGKVISPNGFNNDMPKNVTNAPVAPPRTVDSRKKRRGSRVPLTMVAAFMTVVIFGGLLVSQLAPDDLEPTPISLTEVGDTELIITDDFGGEVGLVPENDNPDSGIIATPTPLAPQPTLTFSPTPLLPTTTPMPPPIGTLPENAGGGVMTDSSFAPAQGCIIRNDTQGALTVYRDASFESNPVGVMSEGGESSIRVQFEGWYELSYGRWVFGSNVTVIGDCSSIITATPTAIGDTGNSGGVNDGIPNCTVTNNSTDPMSLYQWPDYNSPINGRLAPGQSADVVIGNNGWYQIFYAQWVEGSNVTVTGNGCGNLWTPTPTFSASPTPLPTLPADADNSSPSAIVQTTNSVMRGAPTTNAPVITSYAQGTSFRVLAHNAVVGPERWYLVSDISGVTGWIPAIDVQVTPNDLVVVPAATIPVLPTVTPQGFVPTPGPERWSHLSTVVEQGCGGETGVQSTIAVQIQRFDGFIQLTYPATGASFTLNAVSPERYIGSYQTSATIEVDLTFTSASGYIASETVTAESGCIVRMTWTGTRS